MATRFKRAMAPLDAEARARLWESSGAGAAVAAGGAGAVELEELVHSFYSDEAFHKGEAEEEEEEERPGTKWQRDLEAVLKDAGAAEPVAEWIRVKAEAAVRSAGLICEEHIRRRLVHQMLKRGLDAGICESRWESPAGSHEYIDVVVGKSRYIVEINLAGEFEIARPTKDYVELLRYLPPVFVGRPAALEAVIELMCLAAQESIKIAGMHVPPWRRRKYMREKWFGKYRRQMDASSSSDSRRMSVYAGQRACRTKSVGIKDSRKLVKDTFLSLRECEWTEHSLADDDLGLSFNGILS